MKNGKLFSAFIALTLVTLFAFPGAALAWPGSTEGTPRAFDAGDSRGFFIWHNDNGWHIRTTTHGREHVFTAVIKTDGRFVGVDGKKLENDDRVRLSPDRDTLHIRLETAGGADGVDFRVAGGDRLTFNLFMDGRPVDNDQIYLGRHGVHPRDNRFSVRR